jgi:hypothetical protein
VVVVHAKHTDDWFKVEDEVYVFETSVIDNEEEEYNCGQCNEELPTEQVAFFKANLHPIRGLAE